MNSNQVLALHSLSFEDEKPEDKAKDVDEFSALFPDCPEAQESQFNLTEYAQHYAGFGRLARLRFIAKVCPSLRVNALEMAVDHVKTTFNVRLYDLLHEALCEAIKQESTQASQTGACEAGSSENNQKKPSLVCYDEHWVENNTMEAALLLQELESDLKFKKTYSGNADIRRIFEEIGDYHVMSGNLKMAFMLYSRVRPYCTHSDNVISMYRNLVRVSIYMANWGHVLHCVDQVKQYAFGFEHLAKTVPSRLSCAAGLANLGLKQYTAAAHCFLLTPFNQYDFMQIASPKDICYYAGLCALVALDREEMETKVLNSEFFKPFFDEAPKMWDILAKFYRCEFDECWSSLSEIKNSMRLDLFMAPHVDLLYSKIHTRISQYGHSINEELNESASDSYKMILETASQDENHYDMPNEDQLDWMTEADNIVKAMDTMKV